MHSSHPHRSLPPSTPVLKWTGGKRRLLPQLLPLLPLQGRLVEPFVGAGSVFLAADYDRYVINDANPDLAAFWVSLRERPAQFMRDASAFFVPENHSPDAYARVRGEFNAAVESYQRAVRLPYLNKFCFNGLFRVNSKGQYNVPYGKPAKLPRFPFEEAAAAAEKLKRCVIMNGDFEAVIGEAGFGDTVYCDPPYLDSAVGASFTGYTAGGFDIACHRRLIEASKRAVERGATVLISNHDTEEVRELCRGWEIHRLSVRRSVASRSSSRGVAAEVVATLRPSAMQVPR